MNIHCYLTNVPLRKRRKDCLGHTRAHLPSLTQTSNRFTTARDNFYERHRYTSTRRMQGRLRRNGGSTVCNKHNPAHSKSLTVCRPWVSYVLCIFHCVRSSGDASFKMLYKIPVNRVEGRQIHNGSGKEGLSEGWKEWRANAVGWALPD